MQIVFCEANMNEMYKLITTKHSCRSFSDKKVAKSDIEKILDCGLSAPSAMNKQPWFFVVITDCAVIKKLNTLAQKNFLDSKIDWRVKWAKMENFSPFYNPNVLILICAERRTPNAKNDCCFAVQNMTLMAQSMGINSCIVQDVCWAIDESNQVEFGIPEDYEIYLALSLGYPKVINDNLKKINGSKVKWL